MLKSNGMVRPTDKKEIANIKSKFMLCDVCGETFKIEKSCFSGNKCPICSTDLLDINNPLGNKITGI